LALDVTEKYARRESAPHTAVLKLLHPAARIDPKALGRLEKEVEVLRRLDHSALIKILDASPKDGWYVTPPTSAEGSEAFY
jgi:serine/threonine protein kinase